MKTINEDYINPFENDEHQFLVIGNQQNQLSLWPYFAVEPQGWQTKFGPDTRNLCLEFIDVTWQDDVLFPNAARGLC